MHCLKTKRIIREKIPSLNPLVLGTVQVILFHFIIIFVISSNGISTPYLLGVKIIKGVDSIHNGNFQDPVEKVERLYATKQFLKYVIYVGENTKN
jgi:hypothetical protein